MQLSGMRVPNLLICVWRTLFGHLSGPLFGTMNHRGAVQKIEQKGKISICFIKTRKPPGGGGFLAIDTNTGRANNSRHKRGGQMEPIQARPVDKTKHEGNRPRMRDECVALFVLLSQRNRISIAEIGDSLQMSPWTVRRWVHCFICLMDIRIERGIVIIERN